MRRTPKQRKNSESENAESEDGNADVEDDSGNPDEGGDNIGDKALSDTTSIYHRLVYFFACSVIIYQCPFELNTIWNYFTGTT